MGYTANVRSVYRNGYRPVGRTDTFAATHLGSVGTGVALFGPERLSGMGQHRPFPEAGGYMLHGPGVWGPAPRVKEKSGGLAGLGAIVPDQSVVNYQGTWQSDLITSSQNILLAVTAALTQDGFAVRNSQISTSGIAGALGVEESYGVTLQLQVNNGMGFGDPNDIISIISHEVFVASGYMPLAGSIPTVQAPGAAGAVATGQPTVTGAPPLPGMATDFTSWIEQNAMMIGIGAAALVLLPMFLGRR